MELPASEWKIAEIARDCLKSILPQNFDINILRTDHDKKRKTKLAVLGEFKPEDVLSRLTNTDDRIEFKVGQQTYLVKMNSHRYYIFQHSPHCAACGSKGVKFLLEQHTNDKSPHFNFYSVQNGKLVLMTKDHIQAKALGGEDRHSNYQTMCSICNNLKGSDILTLDGISELRKLFDENKHKIPKKKLNCLLNEARKRLVVSFQNLNNDNSIRLTTDINILQNSDGLHACPVYDVPTKGSGWNHVASIKKGWKIFSEEFRNGKLVVRYDEKQTFELHCGLTTWDSASQSATVSV